MLSNMSNDPLQNRNHDQNAKTPSSTKCHANEWNPDKRRRYNGVESGYVDGKTNCAKYTCSCPSQDNNKSCHHQSCVLVVVRIFVRVVSLCPSDSSARVAEQPVGTLKDIERIAL